MSKQKGNVFDSLKRVSENVTRVYQSGIAVGVKQAGEVVKNEFWDGVLSGANWQQKFAGSSWNDNTFYPNQDLKPKGYANNLFALCEITDLVGRLTECGVTLDTSGIIQRSDGMFNYCTKLTSVPYLDLRNVTYSGGVLSNMFASCSALKTIEGIHLAEDGSQVFGSTVFTGCKNLEDVTFYGKIGKNIGLKDCTKLSIASMKSIISCLLDYSGTENEFVYKVTFTEDRWAALEADSTAPDGGTWREYANKLGWNA